MFRFDLVGLGDSSGPTSADLETYWDEVLLGRNDETTVALIERIQLEFGVAQVVVGGLCAATLPSVRALARGRSAPAGLILLEPRFRVASFYEPKRVPLALNIGPSARIGRQLTRGMLALGLGAGSRFARATHSVRALLGGLQRRSTHALPSDANLPLIACWSEALARGVPSLVVVAAGHDTDRYVTRVLDSMTPRSAGGVTCVRLPGTNHLFTRGSGRDDVVAALEQWVIKRFDGSLAPAVVQ